MPSNEPDLSICGAEGAENMPRAMLRMWNKYGLKRALRPFWQGYSHVAPTGLSQVRNAESNGERECQRQPSFWRRALALEFAPMDSRVTARRAGVEQVLVEMKTKVAIKRYGFGDTRTGEVVVDAAAATEGEGCVRSV